MERRLKHKLDARERLSIFERRIVPQLFIDAKPSRHPRCVVYGGQPGAGKSRSIGAALAEFKSVPAVSINGDELRGYHPRFEELLRIEIAYHLGDEAVLTAVPEPSSTAC